jgi:membrane fusion protein, heavy metal efflux system
LRILGLPDFVLKDLDVETMTANLLPLRAPFEGQVVERDTATGEVIQANQMKTLFVFADIRALHVDLDVNPEDIGRVKVGQAVLFKPDGSSLEVQATVTHISPAVDEKTRRVRIHAALSNPDEKIRPNTYGIGRISIRELAQTIVVPVEALQLLDDPDSTNKGHDKNLTGASGLDRGLKREFQSTPTLVFVRLSETEYEARPVRPGLRHDALIEVSGVRAGENIVTTGSFALKSELLKEQILEE